MLVAGPSAAIGAYSPRCTFCSNARRLARLVYSGTVTSTTMLPALTFLVMALYSYGPTSLWPI